MARDPKGPPSSVPHAIRQELDSLWQELNMLKENTVTTMQQIDINDIEDPLEGENVIDHTDDVHKWYSHGAWHSAASGVGNPVGLYRHDNIYTFNATPKTLGLDLAGTSDSSVFSENGIYARFTAGCYLLHAHLQFDATQTFTGGGGYVAFALTLPVFPNWSDQFMGQIIEFDPTTTVRIRTMEFQAIVVTDDTFFDVNLNLQGAQAGQGITEFGLDIVRLRDFDFTIT